MTIFPESLRSSGLHITRSPGEAFTPTPGGQSTLTRIRAD